MADDYSVELQGHVFTASPRVTWSSQATHRFDAVPSTLAWWDYTIELDGCRVRTTDGTPDKAQEAFGSFVTACLHPAAAGGLLPTYLKILNAADGLPIDEIGKIQPGTDGWEELLVTALKLPPGESQFRAGVEFGLVLTARKTFVDANGLVFARRSHTTSYGASGGRIVTLRGEFRMRAGTPVPTTASWFLTLARVPAPATWVRSLGGDLEVEYPRHGQLHEVTTTSQARQLRGGVSPPIGSTDGTETESRREALELGLVRVTKGARAKGTDSSDSWVDGRRGSFGGVGARDVDYGEAEASATWERWEAPGAPIAGKVYGVIVERDFVPGGSDVVEARLTGNVLGPLRIGPVTRWRLREVATVSALGATNASEVPTLKDLPAPWVLIPKAGADAWRRPDAGASPAQHRWERTTTRDYWWDGDGDPRKDDTVRVLLVKSYAAGDGAALA